MVCMFLLTHSFDLSHTHTYTHLNDTGRRQQICIYCRIIWYAENADSIYIKMKFFNVHLKNFNQREQNQISRGCDGTIFIINLRGLHLRITLILLNHAKFTHTFAHMTAASSCSVFIQTNIFPNYPQSVWQFFTSKQQKLYSQPSHFVHFKLTRIWFDRIIFPHTHTLREMERKRLLHQSRRKTFPHNLSLFLITHFVTIPQQSFWSGRAKTKGNLSDCFVFIIAYRHMRVIQRLVTASKQVSNCIYVDIVHVPHPRQKINKYTTCVRWKKDHAQSVRVKKFTQKTE